MALAQARAAPAKPFGTPIVVLAERDKVEMDREVSHQRLQKQGCERCCLLMHEHSAGRFVAGPWHCHCQAASRRLTCLRTAHCPQISEALGSSLPVITRSGAASRLEDLRRAAVADAGTVLVQYPDGKPQVSLRCCLFITYGYIFR